MLSHVHNNNPAMVDVSAKSVTKRTAVAEAIIHLPQVICEAFTGGELVTAKGPVFHTAIIAGTQAVKKTAELIPFCHTLPIEHCTITLTRDGETLTIQCEVTTTAKTGVEMEALTGASVAALTFYDMTKALTHEIVIERISLIAKTGGKRDIDTRRTA
jgi:cyclic pyranopterin phosphate synthase